MSRRKELDSQPVDAQHLHKLMRRLFPRKTKQHSFDGDELVQEFLRFGIRSRKQARLLLKKHRRSMIDIDREPLDGINERIQSSEFGEEFVPNFRRTRLWFTHAGLARLALELEFGDSYRQFARIDPRTPSVSS